MQITVKSVAKIILV